MDTEIWCCTLLTTKDDGEADGLRPATLGAGSEISGKLELVQAETGTAEEAARLRSPTLPRCCYFRARPQKQHTSHHSLSR